MVGMIVGLRTLSERNVRTSLVGWLVCVCVFRFSKVDVGLAGVEEGVKKLVMRELERSFSGSGVLRLAERQSGAVLVVVDGTFGTDLD